MKLLKSFKIIWFIILCSGCRSVPSNLIENTALALSKSEICKSIPRWHLTMLRSLDKPGIRSLRQYCLLHAPADASFRATEYIQENGIQFIVKQKLQQPEWSRKFESKVSELMNSLDENGARIVVNHDINKEILSSMAEMGELDEFWAQKGIVFEPSLKSYYETKAHSPLKVALPKDGYDAIAEKVENYPSGDCHKVWFEYRRNQCWIKFAVLDLANYQKRLTICQKITSDGSRQSCYKMIADLGDVDLRQILRERGRPVPD